MKKVCICTGLLLNMLYAFAQQTDASVSQTNGSAQGYVLFSPLGSKTTYLIDKCGNVMHSWISRFRPAQSVYLLADGSLLRPAEDTVRHGISSVGGIIERFDWDNNLLWSYAISDTLQRHHHDVYPMPNGNVLAIVYRKRSRPEMLSVGRKPSDKEPYLLDEKIVEIKPVGKDSGIIVWQWDVWDHLVQDVDPRGAGYGEVVQNPQLININYAPTAGTDWLHFNAVSYNAALDQIIISNHELSEIYIVDHSTTTAEAASHKGGKRGKGGDILYRWGNPAAYNAGTAKDQTFFRQHNAHWIPKGMKDEGKIMVFNNGEGRCSSPYSTVEIIDPPVDKKGNYRMEKGQAALPVLPYWEYIATNPASFFSQNISSAQRLANGNTLICVGHRGRFFEIDSDKKTVWTFGSFEEIASSAGKGVNQSHQFFRCTFYDFSYGAFKDRNLSPCAPVEIKSRHTSAFSASR